MLTVPIIDSFAQSLRVSLGGQACRIDIRQKSTGLFLDLYINDATVIIGVACRNQVRVVRSVYLGFVGDLAFVDMQGSEDPSSPGLGSRFLLCYLESTDIA